MDKKPNKLIHETSPYLQQHAYNPVEWYPWSEEALSLAKKENKPILVSIGYSACHWCHVMERESFENEETAGIMNSNFVNIKIDREERPDLDHIYMDAVQAMTGSGGWPLNVFLTPEGKPFYGGTYFPPIRAYNRPSWTEILQSVSKAFKEKRNEIDSQAENLTEYLAQANVFGNKNTGTESFLSAKTTDDIFRNIMKSADQLWGGFGSAPKFPQSFVILFLLRYYYITKNKEALKQAQLSIDKMIEGGIYDHLGGGFARYSTDAEWLAPHFEKMLYDNALLISLLSEAYQLTKKERYKKVIEETMEFVQRELMHQDGGFYSALDADSEGVEGKFYVWDFNEVKEYLGDDADIFCEYYDITTGGNWEHKNILRTKKSLENFAEEKNIEKEDLKNLLENGRKKLFTQRNKRTRPGLDDKIILGWNALMNSAYSNAYAATGNDTYLELAKKNMGFLLQNFQEENSSAFYHTWKNNSAKFPAFLDDYAFLINALINLQEVSAEKKWLLKAREITEFVLENFSDRHSSFFFFTNAVQKDIIIRKKEIYDGAVPSGNSVMAFNLHYLSIVFDIPDWKEKSKNILSSLADVITKHPTSFGNFACLFQEIIFGGNEIVIIGIDHEKILLELLKEYIPHRVIIATENPDSSFKMLEGKEWDKTTLIYLCRQYVCYPPLSSINDLISLINSQIKA